MYSIYEKVTVETLPLLTLGIFIEELFVWILYNMFYLTSQCSHIILER